MTLLKRILAAFASPAVIAQAAPRPMNIHAGALDRIAPRGGEMDVFAPAEPMPGVVPEGGRTMAMDEAISTAYSYAGHGIDCEGVQWLGYPYLSQLAQRPEYRRSSEIIAKEMTRKWIKIAGAAASPKDGNEADQSKKLNAKIKELEAEFKRLKVRAAFRMAAQIDGFFGRAQIFLDMGASDAENTKPLIRKPEKIKKGSLKALKVVEPYWTYPAQYNSTNPLAQDFYRPHAWYVNGLTIHYTRLLTFIGREVPDLLKPAYSFGGVSLSQLGKPYVDNFLRTRQSVSDLIHSFSTMVLKTDMATVLQGGAADDLINRIALFNLFRDNRGTFALNKDTEEMENIAVPLGTLDKLQAQSQEHMASVWGIPLIVLLGITPSGLNATSEGELQTFYAWIHAQQEDLFQENLQAVFEAAQLNLWGEIDPALTFTFVPLWQMSEVEAATVRKTDAETDSIYITDAVISPHEARVTVATAEDSRYAGLDLNDDPDPIVDPSAEEFGMPAGKAGVEQKEAAE